MVHRRSSVIATGLLLAAPVLSSCGFNYQTDRINTISTGVNDRDGEIDVLGAVIIADQDDAGLFVGSLANNSTTDPDTLTTVGGTVDAPDDLTPVDVPAAGAVSLFDQGGIAVTGTFTAGDFVSISLEFSGGQKTTLSVPVVKPCYQYDPAKFDPPLVLPSPGTAVAGTPSDGATPTEGTAPAEQPTTGGDPAVESATEPGLYSCDIETRDEPTPTAGAEQ